MFRHQCLHILRIHLQETARIALPAPDDNKSVVIDGVCSPDGKGPAMMSISWNISNSLSLHFNNSDKGQVFLSGLDFDYNRGDEYLFPNTTEQGRKRILKL